MEGIMSFCTTKEEEFDSFGDGLDKPVDHYREWFSVVCGKMGMLCRKEKHALPISENKVG